MASALMAETILLASPSASASRILLLHRCKCNASADPTPDPRGAAEARRVKRYG